MMEIAEELQKYEIDITAIQEEYGKINKPNLRSTIVGQRDKVSVE
jgi:hypothetical protein